MPFDPDTRRETWLFQEMYRDSGNRPVYRRLSYNLVEYDGDPDKYIEPVSMQSEDEMPFDARTSGDPGAMVRFEIYTSRPFELHSFNDFNP
jgi:hypothetical protein